MFARFTTMKDSALTLALKTYIGDRFSAFGTLEDCQIDTRNSRILISAHLKGEHELIEVRVDRYQLERRGGDRVIILNRIHSNREWVGLLLTRLMADKPLKLPAALAALL